MSTKRSKRAQKTKKKNALEARKIQNDKEKLFSFGELRSFNEEDGTFEGYITVWDTVDDYNSTFLRGSFAKTIQERGSKVKVFYDHEHLVGSSLEVREDDTGVFCRGKLNLSVEKAKEAYEFMKDGTLEGLSFSFRSVKESFVKGVRQIEEVQLFEYGPVVFPANDEALIANVRSQNFDQSLTEELLFARNNRIQIALGVTLDDIWWANDTDSDNVLGKIDGAISSFRVAYLEFATDWVKEFWLESRSAPTDNELSKAFSKHIVEERGTIAEFAANSSFTVQESENLRRGKLIEAREKLAELPKNIQLAHQEQRNKNIEKLCLELRDGLSSVEKRRIKALLQTAPTNTEEEVTFIDVLQDLNSFNDKLEIKNA